MVSCGQCEICTTCLLDLMFIRLSDLTKKHPTILFFHETLYDLITNTYDVDSILLKTEQINKIEAVL